MTVTLIPRPVWQLWPLLHWRSGYADRVIELELPFCQVRVRYFRAESE